MSTSAKYFAASNPEYFKHSGKISVDNLLSNLLTEVDACQVQHSSSTSDDLWDVFISLCMRLIGEKFSEKLEELHSAMVFHYDKQSIPRVASSPED